MAYKVINNRKQPLSTSQSQPERIVYVESEPEIVEVPVEVIKEVIKEVEKPVLVEKETVVYVDKPYPVEVIKEIEKPVEVVKEVKVTQYVDRVERVKQVPLYIYVALAIETLVIISLILTK